MISRVKSTLKFFSEANKVSCRIALRQAIDEEMERNPDVFLMGEEVAVYQGAYKISASLYQKYGEKRVIDTPITEAGFTGLAVGASMNGLTPIVEFMTWNFALQSIDHIINSCAKTRYMSGGDISGSIVFRGLNGPAAYVGAQHSQCFAAWYSNVPGLRVVSPYDAYDCKRLLKASIREKNPVVFLENELMYSKEFEVGEDFADKDIIDPIGKAKIMRAGKDCTVVSFSRMVGECLLAAEILEKQGISVEVINLRTIKPIDRNTIIESVKKTGRLVAVEDGWPQSGVTAEVISIVTESEAFDYLDAHPERVSSWDIPLPYAKSLEVLSTPHPEHIVASVLKTLQGTKLVQVSK